jgi:hypothetical protein
MKYTKIFADEKGETHFKDVEIKLGSVDFAPPAPPINLSSYNPATSMPSAYSRLGGLGTGIQRHKNRFFSFSQGKWKRR